LGSRREGRIIAVCAIYESEITGRKKPDELVRDVISLAGKTVDEATRKFALELVTKAIENKNGIDEMIKNHLLGWEFERLNPLDKSFLTLGVTEMMFFPDVPAVSALDEVIEIAKEYGGSASSRFVNGVLDNVYKKLKGDKK
jgi:N utilization substance protein B